MKRMFKLAAMVALVVGSFSVTTTMQAETIKLSTSNTIILRGEVNDTSIGAVVRQLMLTDKHHLYLYITSPGGNILAGNRLVGFLDKTDKKVTCIADFAASMAFIIFQHCSERIVMSDSLIMSHEASLGASGELPNFLSWVRLLEGIVKSTEEGTAAKLGLSHKDYKAKIANDWWMYGNAAVEENAADDRAQVLCTKKLTNRRDTQIVRGRFGNIELKWSGCPLIAYPVSINGQKFMSDNEQDDLEDSFRHYVKGSWNPTFIKKINAHSFK